MALLKICLSINHWRAGGQNWHLPIRSYDRELPDRFLRSLIRNANNNKHISLWTLIATLALVESCKCIIFFVIFSSS